MKVDKFKFHHGDEKCEDYFLIAMILESRILEEYILTTSVSISTMIGNPWGSSKCVFKWVKLRESEASGK